jgi:hypothetical protein
LTDLAVGVAVNLHEEVRELLSHVLAAQPAELRHELRRAEPGARLVVSEDVFGACARLESLLRRHQVDKSQIEQRLIFRRLAVAKLRQRRLRVHAQGSHTRRKSETFFAGALYTSGQIRTGVRRGRFSKTTTDNVTPKPNCKMTYSKLAPLSAQNGRREGMCGGGRGGA